MVTITLDVGRPKREFVEMAYEECGLASYEFGAVPDELNSGIRELNFLAMELAAQGIDLGYSQPDYGVGTPEEASGIPEIATGAVVKLLAQRLAPKLGKTLSPESNAARMQSVAFLRINYATIPTLDFPLNTAAGVGTSRLTTFLPVTSEEE